MWTIDRRWHIVAWRFQYLISSRAYRKGNQQIIFIGETRVDRSLTFIQSEFYVAINTGSFGRLFVVDVGSVDRLVGKTLLIFKAESVYGNYHSVNF